MSFHAPERGNGWNQVLGGQYSREDMARMTPEQRKAMIQTYTDTQSEGKAVNLYGTDKSNKESVFGPNTIAKGISNFEKVKAKFGGKGKGKDTATVEGTEGTHQLDRTETQDTMNTLVDDEKKGGEFVSVKAV